LNDCPGAGIVHCVVVMHNEVPQPIMRRHSILGYSAFVASDILHAASPRILKPRSVAHCSVLSPSRSLMAQPAHIIWRCYAALSMSYSSAWSRSSMGIEDGLVAKDRRLAIGIADGALFDQVDWTPKQRRQLLRRSTRSSVLHEASGSKVTSRSTSLSAFAVPRATEPNRDSSPIRQRRHNWVSDSLDGKMIVSMEAPLSHKALAAPRHLRPCPFSRDRSPPSRYAGCHDAPRLR
jgi:hypothetical protein